MSDFKVDYRALSGAADNFSNIKQRFSQYGDDIRSVADNLPFRISAVTALGIKLRLMSNNSRTLAWKSGNISTAAEKISEEYRNRENTIENVSDQEAHNGAGNQKQQSRNDDSDNPFLNFIKKMGLFGATVTFGDGLVSMVRSDTVEELVDNTIKTISKTVKSCIKLDDIAEKIGKRAKQTSNSVSAKASWWKEIFGLKNYFDDDTLKVSKAKNLAKRFTENFKNTSIKEISKIGWVDLIVSGIINTIDNKNEYESGEISAERAVAETINETGVDIATDVVLAAGATAVVGAVCVAAPVLAPFASLMVAGLTTGAKWGLDAVAKWATGGEKDFTEAVSDTILDAGGTVVEETVHGVKEIGKGISSAFKSLSAKWCLAV